MLLDESKLATDTEPAGVGMVVVSPPGMLTEANAPPGMTRRPSVKVLVFSRSEKCRPPSAATIGPKARPRLRSGGCR
jgi:hypothetical protein